MDRRVVGLIRSCGEEGSVGRRKVEEKKLNDEEGRERRRSESEIVLLLVYERPF